MEREQRAKHAETDEHEREQHVLNGCRDVVVVRNLKDVHRRSTVEEVDAYQAKDDERRTAHKHQRKLHGCILLATRTPETNEKVHRDECHLVEHEHGEEVDRDEETVNTCREKSEPHEELLGEGLELP